MKPDVLAASLAARGGSAGDNGRQAGTAVPTSQNRRVRRAVGQAFSLACLASRLARDTVRLSFLSAGCWLAICNASSPQLRPVRVPIVNGGDIPFTHLSLEKAPALGIVNRIVQ